ncbi:MAG: hypothetical protein DRH37_01395 [Deltaproteobacteria bacterium]|nr:MAG: hypothetical protein DRH37_01395 [Deltaproteobacteria bacterium]
MKNNSRENEGLKELYRRYRRAFRIPENLAYYSESDFKSAERNFIRYAMLNRTNETLTSDVFTSQ